MARSEKRTPDADATQRCSKYGLSVPASLRIARTRNVFHRLRTADLSRESGKILTLLNRYLYSRHGAMSVDPAIGRLHDVEL